MESNQPRVAAQPALTTGTGAGRESLRISARVVLLGVEVLIIHLVVCGKKIRVEPVEIGAGIMLEPVGETGGSDEDAFVHDEPPEILAEKLTGNKKTPTGDRRSFKVKRQWTYGVKSWRPSKPAAGFASLTNLMFSSLTMFNTSLSAQIGHC